MLRILPRSGRHVPCIHSDNKRERHCAVPQGTLPALSVQTVGVLFTLHITAIKYSTEKTQGRKGLFLLEKICWSSWWHKPRAGMLHISVNQETQKAGYSPQVIPIPRPISYREAFLKVPQPSQTTPLAEDPNVQMHEPIRHSSNQIVIVSGSVGGWVEGIQREGVMPGDLWGHHH